MPGWFEVYVGLEEAASVIRGYEAQFIPGLLQSEDYARAVIRDGYPLAAPEEIERRVRLRMNRARLVHSAEPPRIWSIVDEAACAASPAARPSCGPSWSTCWSCAGCRTSPSRSRRSPAAAPGGGRPFTLLRFAEPALPDIVYLEQLTGAAYLDKREDLDAYTTVMDQLCLDALPAAAPLNSSPKWSTSCRRLLNGA